eukprot:scaffold122130_cov23-Prasinocladus_malaysianus.AAC.1
MDDLGNVTMLMSWIAECGANCRLNAQGLNFLDKAPLSALRGEECGVHVQLAFPKRGKVTAARRGPLPVWARPKVRTHVGSRQW